MSKYLDSTGLSYLWNKLKSTFATKTEVSSEYNVIQGAISTLQTSVAALTGLDSTNFGGFSIESTESDAITNIATLYTADGYTDELLWYMAGTSLSSVKAYRYNGSGTPTAISSDTYNCVDFSGLIADVNTLRQDLDALGPKNNYNNDVDFEIQDEHLKSIVQFREGHLVTKNFDSRIAPKLGLSIADFEIVDTNDKAIVRFIGGHILTKNFDSRSLINSSINGKKIVFIGDSITYGEGLSNRESDVYHAQLADKEGCVSVGLGISGTGLCTNMSNGLSPNRFITRATQANLSSADIIVIFGGTNDFTYDSKAIGDYFTESTITPSQYIGSVERTPPSDTDTFSGALHELILHIRSITDVPLVYITPLHRTNYSSGRPSSTQSNSNGDFLSDYVDAIKAICRNYSVPVLDLYSVYNLDFNDSSMAQTYSVDGIHPNKDGHTIIAKLLSKFIKNNLIF